MTTLYCVLIFRLEFLNVSLLKNLQLWKVGNTRPLAIAVGLLYHPSSNHLEETEFHAVVAPNFEMDSFIFVGQAEARKTLGRSF
jgi:hypothetical protein